MIALAASRHFYFDFNRDATERDEATGAADTEALPQIIMLVRWFRLAVIEKNYQDGKYESRTEAENKFRKLVECEES